MIKQIFAEKVYMPLVSALMHKGRDLKYLNLMRKEQKNSIKDNRRLHAKRLYSLVSYACSNIPYYKRISTESGFHTSEGTIYEDIKRFPILTKEILKNESGNLFNIQAGIKWNYNHSGGSTGQPTKFISDEESDYWLSMVKIFQKEWAGYRYGDKIFRLWGSQRDILKEKEKIKSIFTKFIRSDYWFNSFSMDKQHMNEYVQQINKIKPRLILAYAQSMYEISKYIEENMLEVYSPSAIMTSAGILYPSFREQIERVFKCQVFNRYGSREVGDMACECEKHEGLHIMTFTHYLEILDDNLNPVKEGETGDIYVTLLTNYTMPLIRYKIGDRAVYTEKRCLCGRGLPLIKDVIGRDMDVFKTRDGKIVPGEFFIHFIGVVYNDGFIDKFQAIQKDYDKILIKIVLNDIGKFEHNKSKIEDSIKEAMGKECKIDWEQLDTIESTKSGKYRYTISEMQ